ncbi:aminopeptidase P family protein [Acinetobacter nectaris]|uniref:aminopeptidase P family protein n=1 Tax=Acinetobacter nectaris TaxID=1219382 RepID=UPI001F2446C1|nr:aminopeptidase P family protein [Acinetobacter nectaris]MCF9034258.1 aminopeptidase P family protein [Acinetobacter nectaris]
MQDMSIQEKLKQLRQQMQTHHIHAYIIPSADPHMSEYLPEYWQTRVWLSGFTGSVGTLVVTENEAGLWVDGRYWVQAEQQLRHTEIKLQKLNADPASTHISWLAKHLNSNDIVATDGKTLSISQYQQLLAALSKKNIGCETTKDFISPLWKNRPALPKQPMYEMQAGLNHLTRLEKIQQVSQYLSTEHIDGHFISSLDDIAWLLNCRGEDVEYNPIFLAHMYISKEGTTTLFIHEEKIPHELKQALLKDKIEILRYEDSAKFLAQITDQTLLLDPNKVSIYHANALSQATEIVKDLNPTTRLKAIKSPSEIQHIQNAMLKDGIALCHFFSWLEHAVQNQEVISELTIDEKITAYRAAQDGFLGPSFATIAGFNANGALPHYRATKEQFSYIQGNGLLLIDSGGQYIDGTTDITRVIPIGTPTDEQKHDYTLVLKSHIALAQAIFPVGLPAPLLDSIARQPLWQENLNFRHGTGHGVGFALNVHEGPHSISYYAPVNKNTAMLEGMITSNEPGLYREGQWGIRIENLIVNEIVPHETQEYGEFLCFKNLTLCPINIACIQQDLLTDQEKQWLNKYHEQVQNTLLPHLMGEAKNWLIQHTKAI